MEPADIEKAFGGIAARSYGAYTSSASAYMLMYRRVDPDTNEMPMERSAFPAHVQDLLVEVQRRNEEMKKRREEELRSVLYTVYYFNRDPDPEKLEVRACRCMYVCVRTRVCVCACRWGQHLAFFLCLMLLLLRGVDQV